MSHRAIPKRCEERLTSSAANDRLRFELARNAQARLIENDFSTRTRAKRLVTLSRDLLSQNLAERTRETQLTKAAKPLLDAFGSESFGATAHSNPQPIGDQL